MASAPSAQLGGNSGGAGIPMKTHPVSMPHSGGKIGLAPKYWWRWQDPRRTRKSQKQDSCHLDGKTVGGTSKSRCQRWLNECKPATTSTKRELSACTCVFVCVRVCEHTCVRVGGCVDVGVDVGRGCARLIHQRYLQCLADSPCPRPKMIPNARGWRRGSCA